MADSTGDPETGKDVEDLTKSLEELCESSKEQSEEVLLLSHLEQHHHLVSVLKGKMDDTHKRCRDLEQLNMELEKLRGEDAVKIKTQTHRIQYLEGRFTDLVKNHENIIQFKNEHNQHLQLREESKCLWQDREALFSQAVREKEAEVLQLAAQARRLSQQFCSLQEKYASESHRAQEREKELLEAQCQLADGYAQEVDSLKRQLQLLQERHQQAGAESQQRAQGSELQAKLERAHEEKEQLLNLAMERSKALQDKEREIQKLEEKLETMEEAMQRAGRCLKKEAAEDLKVQELQGQLERSKQAYNELLLQFSAYRKHSMDLLTKERALNIKRHHFVA
ncbi:LOW QUALITY PROTEIN: coiled-coil domain-containing protein 89 [Ammospiza maritima maritima]